MGKKAGTSSAYLASEATHSRNFSFLIWTLGFHPGFLTREERASTFRLRIGPRAKRGQSGTTVPANNSNTENKRCARKVSLGRDESCGVSNSQRPAKPQPIQTDLLVKSSIHIQSSRVDCMVALAHKHLYLTSSVPLRTVTLKDRYFLETCDHKVVLDTARSNMQL